jgi:CTP:molybdopterin cytidylyltransferase MocA
MLKGIIPFATEIAARAAVSAAAAAEQILLVNRDQPFVSETDGSRVSDREQLRRYFLEDWRGKASYQRP